MKSILKAGMPVFMTTFLFAGSAFAVNGNQVMGVGAYQEGIGGAVTAAPFDSTTIITNPAGIVKVGDRFDFNAALFRPVREVDYSSTGGGSTKGGTDQYLLPSLGVTSDIGDGYYVGFAMAVTAGMGADFGPLSAGALGTSRQFSQMQFWKMAPSIAKKINDRLSVGFALNIDYQQIQLQSTYSSARGTGGINATTADGAMGYGFTAGLTYEVTDSITIGATYISTQQMGDMKYRLPAGAVALLDPATGSGVVNSEGSFAMGMNFPQQYAVGVNFRVTDDLSISADYKILKMSEEYDQVDITGGFNVFAGGQPTGATTGSATLDFGWEDVNVIAIGAQYRVNDRLWVRAGYNHGNSAVPASKAFNNTAMPAVAEDHYSVGATVNVGERWQGHFSYVTQPVNEVTDPATGTKISLGGSSLQIGFSRLF